LREAGDLMSCDTSLTEILPPIGTMELGRSMMSAGAGASYGVIDNRPENLQH
jgi:hypothetical protein